MADGFTDNAGESAQDSSEMDTDLCGQVELNAHNREQLTDGALAEQARTLRAIHQLLQDLRDFTDLGSTLLRICQFASEILDWRKVIITLRDETTAIPRVRIGASFGLDADLRDRLEAMANAQTVEDWRDERYKVSRSYFFDHRIAGGLAGKSNFLRTGAGDLVADGWRDDDSLAVPVELKDHQYGALIVDDPKSGMRPRRSDVEYLEILADQAAAAIANDVLQSRLQATAREAQTLFRASTVIAGSTDLSELLAKTIDAIDEHFGHRIATIHLRVTGEDRLELKAFRGFRPTDTAALDAFDGPGIIARVARTGVAENVADVRKDPDYIPEIPDTVSELAVPLKIDGDVLGIINVESPEPGAFSESDERVLASFAEQVSVAIHTAQLHEQLQTKARREALLNKMIAAVHQTRDLDEILSIPCLGLAEALDVERTYVATIDWSDRVARFVQAYSKDDSQLFSGVFPLESMPELSARLWRGEVVAAGDVFKEEILKPAWWSYERFNTRSLMYVPVVRSDDWHAVLLVCSARVRNWTDDEISYVETIAKQVGTACLQAEFVEKELQLRREWQLTFDAMSDGVLLLDADRVIKNANAAASALFRSAREEILGRTCCDVLAENETGRCLIHPVFSERRRLRVQSTPKQIGRPTSITADAIASSRGAVVVLRDLSELRRAEAIARRQSAILSNLVSNATDVIAMFSPSGACLWLNNSFAAVLAIDAEDQHDLELSDVIDPGNWTEIEREFKKAVAGEPSLFEISLIPPSGVDMRILVTLTPIVDDETVVGVLFIGRDVTTQRREAERAAEADKLRALGQLSSGVAHNFNNALSVILGRTQLLMRRVKSADIQSELAIIERVSHEASTTVRRIQNFARRKLHESFSPVNMKALLTDTIEMTSAKSREDANARGIDYDVVFDRPETDPFVPGIDSELREIFVNLIFNALDAMPSGGVLRIQLCVEGGFVVVRVTDTGVGMTDEVQRRIFEPFFTTKGVSGTGLGLAVSYGIASRHNGRIEFESSVGIGSTFTVYLPSLTTSIAMATIGDDPHVLAPLARPCRIVVVDDDETVCEVVVEALLDRGHVVLSARNAAEAMAILAKEPADLVISDLSMPDVNGLALIAEIAREWPGTKTILMTGADVEGLEVELSEHAPNLTIAKPFELDRLCIDVESLVEPRQVRGESIA